LFRNLAKRFHPDLVNDPKEKSRRQGIMARINAAYSARDLPALESLARRTELAHNSSRPDPGTELAQLKMELADLEAMVFEVEHTIRELDLSSAMQLRSEYESGRNAGRDFFIELERSLKERIDELREHLLDLDIAPELIWKKRKNSGADQHFPN
jgi:curved DNA-binding protein CbpA